MKELAIAYYDYLWRIETLSWEKILRLLRIGTGVLSIPTALPLNSE